MKLLKKLFMLGLVTCSMTLFGCLTTEASASEPVIELDVYEDTSEFDEMNEYLVERGREILLNPRTRTSVNLVNISRLAQNNPSWANDIMQTEGVTIGSQGCCLTSFTMIRNCISSVSNTPRNVNATLGNYACPFYYNQAASAYGYQILTKARNDAGLNQENARFNIVGAIDDFSRPVLVGLKNSSGATHFVVAKGYNTNGEIYILDPAPANYSNLSSYTNNGYFIYVFYVYD